MTQEERLNFLIRELVKENPDYWEAEVPEGTREREALLRTLMNVRKPAESSAAFLREQDAYLAERLRVCGVTDAMTLPAVPLNARIVLWQGDITLLRADAVVNAANARMLGCFEPLCACVDNQIHTFAGIQLRLACDRQMKRIREKLGETYLQPVSIPMMTDAYNLPAKKVIHVAGPVIRDKAAEEQEEELRACYRNALALCVQNGMRSVAFCCIATGEGRFPRKRAAEIATDAVTEALSGDDSGIRVVFDVFRDEDCAMYHELLNGEEKGDG